MPDCDEPIVLFSSCKDVSNHGFAKYNGGYKLYNLWAKLLRLHGIQSFVVTYDGSYTPWLIDHQPHVSIEIAKKWADAGLNVKLVTGWLDSAAYLDLCPLFYFFDAELAYTSTVHRGLLQGFLDAGRIAGIGTHSRVQQAWYLMNYGFEVHYVPEWSDTGFWRPSARGRIGNRVGYMEESEETERDIRIVDLLCKKNDCTFDFHRIAGDEVDVLEQMGRCDVFLGMNPGKHPLWGEGCPRSQQEAMHAGCVVVAYDVRGNREYLYDGYNGILVPRARPDLLAEQLIALAKEPERKEELRAQALTFARKAMGHDSRFGAVAGFLDLPADRSPLPDVPLQRVIEKVELEMHLEAPVFLALEEIPVLARYASRCTGNMLEIGSAFGASSAILLMYAPPPGLVYSIDPFVKDSMGTFTSSASACRRNVRNVLKRCCRDQAFTRWILINDFSHEVASQWKHGDLDLVFIDGDHTYQAVARDFREWSVRVRRGGYILLHDSRREPNQRDDHFARGWPGPTQLAGELKEHSCVELVEEVFSLTVWRKTAACCDRCSRGTP